MCGGHIWSENDSSRKWVLLLRNYRQPTKNGPIKVHFTKSWFRRLIQLKWTNESEQVKMIFFLCSPLRRSIFESKNLNGRPRSRPRGNRKQLFVSHRLFSFFFFLKKILPQTEMIILGLLEENFRHCPFFSPNISHRSVLTLRTWNEWNCRLERLSFFFFVWKCSAWFQFKFRIFRVQVARNPLIFPISAGSYSFVGELKRNLWNA